MNQASAERSQQGSPSEVMLISQPANRRTVQAFARDCFQRSYGARLQDFLPNTLALVDARQQLLASSGYQCAASSELFLEHYLPQPVEQMIAGQLQIAAPERSQILEVGNLASRSPGSTRRLILNLANHFYQQGYRWLVITATDQVRHSFDKLNVGLQLHPLCQAEADSVGGCSDWGSYYAHNPWVYAGDIQAGLKALNRSPLYRKLLSRISAPVSDCALNLQLRGEVE